MTISRDGVAYGGPGLSGSSPSQPLAPPSPLVAAGTALFLDFDGTLVDIADHPDDVVVAPDLADLVSGLSDALDGRVAIVTGRSIAALEALLGPVACGIAGSHGGEFRPLAAGPVHPLADPLPPRVVAVLEQFGRANGGLLVEPKPFSVAVHYRHHPEALEGLQACAQALAGEFGLGLKHGKQVIELTMPGSDKGKAVARFMALPSFADATPLFLGDDVTDEDAFRAVGGLGGQGVLVGPLRTTAASRHLPDVPAVHAWLKAGLEAAAQGETCA